MVRFFPGRSISVMCSGVPFGDARIKPYGPLTADEVVRWTAAEKK